MTDLYKHLNSKKGKSYFPEQVEAFSLISLYPDIDTSRKLRGNSRTIGDANKDVQDAIIDMIITLSVRYELNYKEIAYILLTAKVESGFNPDAAAGTTSAAGLAQGTVNFIKDALIKSEEILGFQLDLREKDVFDAEKGCYALIYSFILNKSKVMESYTPDQREYWEWLYLLHHDGAYSLEKYLNGTRKKSTDGKKWALYIINNLSIIEGLLKNKEVSTKFKLSTGDNMNIKNKNYIATISLTPNSTCPKLVSHNKKHLFFIKGVTDENGMTESINTITGTEVIFTILRDDYQKLANSMNIDKSTSNNDKTEYIIKKGDTLSEIAIKHGVSLEKIARINKIHNINILHIGAKIKIPDNKRNNGYTGRYVSSEIKQSILDSIGIENANHQAVTEYTRSHIILPHGSKSANQNKENNIIHIKTTSSTNATNNNEKITSEHFTDKNATSKKITQTNEFTPVILFDKGDSDKNRVSDKTKEVLISIAKNAGIHKIHITSTLRTPLEQAQAMYSNILKLGLNSQKHYKHNGREVINAGVEAGLDNRVKAISAMVDKINSLMARGELVSKHCVSEELYAKRNVVDISKNRLHKHAKAFDIAIEEYIKNNTGIYYLSPYKHSGEPVFHLEVDQ